MDLLGIFLLVLAGAMLGSLILVLVYGLRQGHSAATAAEVAALRSCLRLSLAAWQAREEMQRAARASRPFLPDLDRSGPT